MILDFGKYNGKHAGWVMLRDPQYFEWLGRGNPGHTAYIEYLRLRDILDSKPFSMPCYGNCQPRNTATRMSICIGGPDLHFYCDTCNPRILSGGQQLILGGGMRNILHYMPRGEWKNAVRVLGLAKGLPQRLTVKALDRFFADE